jgi:hypothetical protein
MNKRFTRVATLAMGLHLFVWLACFGFLKATGFQLFSPSSLFGFAAPPGHSFLQGLAFCLLGIVSYPVATFPGWGDSRILNIFLLVGNSTVWGIFAATAIYGYRAWLNPGLRWTAR